MFPFGMRFGNPVGLPVLFCLGAVVFGRGKGSSLGSAQPVMDIVLCPSLPDLAASSRRVFLRRARRGRIAGAGPGAFKMGGTATDVFRDRVPERSPDCCSGSQIG